jgi:hypothetical protein
MSVKMMYAKQQKAYLGNMSAPNWSSPFLSAVMTIQVRIQWTVSFKL